MAKPQPGVRRRRVLWGGLTASAALAAGALVPLPAEAHITKPGEWKDPLLESVVQRGATHKAVFSNANVEGPQLLQIRNWLNSMQFSYQTPPDRLLVVAAFYGSSNVITYNDIAWNAYRFGEKYNIVDPTTGKPALRNIFQQRTGTDDGTLPPDDPKSIYQETNVQALQQRGVIFFTWHQTIDGHARAAVADGRSAVGQTVADVVKDLSNNVITDSIIVPAMVGEVSHMQELGFPLVVVPAFRG